MKSVFILTLEPSYTCLSFAPQAGTYKPYRGSLEFYADENGHWKRVRSGHQYAGKAHLINGWIFPPTPDVEAQWEQEQSLQADQESLQVSQVLEGPQQDAVGDGQLTFQDCFA